MRDDDDDDVGDDDVGDDELYTIILIRLTMSSILDLKETGSGNNQGISLS